MNIYDEPQPPWRKRPRHRKTRRRLRRLSVLLSKQNYYCKYCNKHLTINSATIDHVIPLVKGGENNISNMVASCRDCNIKKGNQSPFNL